MPPERTDGFRVITSPDGEDWESAALLTTEGVDLRDPKLSRTPDDRLLLVAGGSIYIDDVFQTRVPRVAFLPGRLRVDLSTACSGRGALALAHHLAPGHRLQRLQDGRREEYPPSHPLLEPGRHRVEPDHRIQEHSSLAQRGHHPLPARGRDDDSLAAQRHRLDRQPATLPIGNGRGPTRGTGWVDPISFACPTAGSGREAAPIPGIPRRFWPA